MIEEEHSRRTALVVVLGDLAASPRTCRHAEALAAHGYDVELVGYRPADAAWSTPSPRIRPRFLSKPPFAGRRGGAGRLLFQAMWRTLVQPLELLLVLVRAPRAELLLVQVPPALPALAVAALVGRVRGIRVVTDWHNFGWSLVALQAGPQSALVRLARWYERRAAALVDAHLCVSRAMQRVLADEWQLDATVFYDRPADVFRSAREDSLRDASNAPATRRASSLARIAGPDAPAAGKLVVTSTSWTPDEDMTMLLDALAGLDRLLRAAERTGGAALLEIVITGRGRDRAAWEERARAQGLRSVVVRTGWLELGEYAALLAGADLGLCLHRSSSGVDLPMKIVDMHGAGLAVAAYDYGSCLRELLVPAEESLTFRTSSELGAVLARLVTTVGDGGTPELEARAAVRSAGGESWLEGWRREALPALEGPPPEELR